MKSVYMKPEATVVFCAAEDMIQTSSLQVRDQGEEIFVEY